MSVRVRLTRVGGKKNAQWRVVVADQRSPRDGRFIEMIGHYNPQTEPSQIVIDRERLDHWLELGAQPSGTVRKLMRARPTPVGAAVTSAEVKPDGEGTAESGGTAETAGTAVTGGSADVDVPAEADADTTGGEGSPAEPDDAK